MIKRDKPKRWKTMLITFSYSKLMVMLGKTEPTVSEIHGTGRKLLAVLYWSDMEEQREKTRRKMKEDSLGTEKSTDLLNENEYTVEGWQSRQLLDTFGDSLRHVNHIYNKEFGFQARKVPGHMPHMIDKNIMYELQSRFPKEWDTTSSHKIRSSTDMQYAFAYYYYMMGVLSDREIRTLAARMYDLPLYLETLTGLEMMFSNCSQNLDDPTVASLTQEQIENYYDKSMAWLEWSHEKYEAVFNSFSDNIAGRSFRERLSVPLPIDVVYTWVNGTDPDLTRQLEMVRISLEQQMNVTREEKCTFTNCLTVGILVQPPLLTNVTVNDIQQADAVFINVTETSEVNLPHGLPVPELIMMSGYPSHYSDGDVQQAVSQRLNVTEKSSVPVKMYKDKGVSLIHISQKAHYDKLTKEKNFTIDHKVQRLSPVKLVWDLRYVVKNDVVASNRFEDNEELRYSLRSLEQFAPWVRHIYIVTNGQIPYWLNLDCPRVTVITHDHQKQGVCSWVQVFMILDTDFLTIQACNNLQCGFDIGDCGVKDYKQLYGLDLDLEKTHYRLPPGELIGYFNLSGILKDKNKVTSAVYSTDTIIRAVAVANKFKVMTVILNKDHNATVLVFDLTYKVNANETKRINFTLHVDTSVTKPSLAPVISSVNETTMSPVKLDDILDAEAFTAFTGHQRIPAVTPDRPLVDLHAAKSFSIDLEILDVYKTIAMSKELKRSLFEIDEANKEGELTEIGLKVKLYELLLHNKEELESLKTVFQEEKLKYSAQKALDKESLNKTQNLSGYRTSAQNVDNKPHHAVSGKTNEPKLFQRPKRYLAIRNLQKGNSPDMENWHQFHDGLRRSDSVYEYGKEGNKKIPSQEAQTVKSEDHLQNSLRSNSRSVIHSVPKLGKYNAKEIYDKTRQAKEMENNADNVQLFKADGHASKTEPTVSEIRGTGRKLLAVLYWSDMEEQREKTRRKMKEDSLGNEMSDEDFLRLVSVGEAGENADGFPWEKKDGNTEKSTDLLNENEYTVEGWQSRQLLDTFGDSLRHVNHIYNKEFGFQARKVPGHMPHMIDKNIMYELQSRFPKEWDTTSSHKIRSSTDMQYAFAYYYYMMGVTVPVSVQDIFNEIDTDHSGVLSDREIRTLAARMYDLPLYLETLTGLEMMFSNCSQNLSDPTVASLTQEQIENYYDKSMPQVTKYFFLHCEAIEQLVKSKFKPKLKYKYTTADDSDITFKMIHTNVSHVVGQLDDIRKHPKKFICLNDNIDHSREEAKTVKAILQDFYESLLPIPSQFELPRDYRNRFLHMSELREWRIYRDRLRFWTHVALLILVMLAILSFLGDKIDALKRKWSNRKRRRRRTSSSTESTPPGSVTVSPTLYSKESSFVIWDAVVETV
ncbi:hypothetical protein Btru_006280 [Bulinus truncatus]|nr:hypothetical protein Btru_006280 [Bulinus truncatus]